MFSCKLHRIISNKYYLFLVGSLKKDNQHEKFSGSISNALDLK